MIATSTQTLQQPNKLSDEAPCLIHLHGNHKWGQCFNNTENSNHHLNNNAFLGLGL